MEINEIRPGMSCMTREGAAYVLEVDRQSLLVLLQRADETIPVQVRSDEILAPLECSGCDPLKTAVKKAARPDRAAIATPSF